MDEGLKEAVCSGDVEFLRNAVATKPEEYFLTEYKPSEEAEDQEVKGNIFHLAAYEKKEDLFREAMELLPTHIKLQLFSPQEDVNNPLHLLAWRYSEEYTLGMVRMVLDFYRSYSGPPDLTDAQKPWLALHSFNSTPLHFALESEFNNHEIAMELLSMGDMEFPCLTVDNNGKSPLFYAFEKGFTRVAEKILTMPPSSYSVAGPNGSTPLHFAPKTSETAVKGLLEKNPELMDAVDDKGHNVLHTWAETGEVWPLNLLLKNPAATTEVFRKLVHQTTEKKRFDNPLHIAARHGNLEFVQHIVNFYQQAVTASAGDIPDCPPWKETNKNGMTPLYTAICAKKEQLALFLLSLDPTLCNTYNLQGESPLFGAVCFGCSNVVDEILRINQDPPSSMLRRNDGATLLHQLHYLRNDQKMVKRLLEKFWWMINLSDDKGKSALENAKGQKIQWLVELLRNPSLIQKESFDWIKYSETDEAWAVLAFIDSCPNLQKACIEKNDTPLHHINLQKLEDYIKLLKNPSIAELKNKTDHNGATPLHRAIERKNMLLTKVLLLDVGVERNIDDCNGMTAMRLLAKLCKQNGNWEKMCKDIKVNPYLRTTYIQSGTNLGEMRNTLSVVAALLATITFAAGFTLPGGLNEDTGTAILGKKAAFLIFLLSDAYAMCTSMLVLFCLIWSMVSTRDMSYLLVDRSVVILMQALYGTMVAFMTGVYAMVANSSLWAVIIIFVMCSFIVLSANRTILYNVLAWLIPTAGEERRVGFESLEEGRAFASENDTSLNPTIPEGPALKIASSHNQDQNDQISLLEEEEVVTSENASSLKARGSARGNDSHTPNANIRTPSKKHK